MSNIDRSLLLRQSRRRQWQREQSQKAAVVEKPPTILKRYERTLVVAIALIVFAGTAYLAARPADSVNFGLVGKVTSLAFSTPKLDALKYLELSELQLGGVAHLEIHTYMDDTPPKKISAPMFVSMEGGPVLLEEFSGTPETTYGVDIPNVRGDYLLTVRHLRAMTKSGMSQLKLSISGGGKVKTPKASFSVEPGGFVIVDVPSNDKDALVLSFKVSSKSSIQLAQQTLASKLMLGAELQKVEERKSPVLDVAVRVFDLPDKVRRLNEGECVLATTQDGTPEPMRGMISSIRLEEEGISLAMSGTATDMRVGNCSSPTSIKPNTLEIWRQNNQVSLLWGAFASAFGLLVAVLKWFSSKSS